MEGVLSVLSRRLSGSRTIIDFPQSISDQMSGVCGEEGRNFFIYFIISQDRWSNYLRLPRRESERRTSQNNKKLKNCCVRCRNGFNKINTLNKTLLIFSRVAFHLHAVCQSEAGSRQNEEKKVWHIKIFFWQLQAVVSWMKSIDSIQQVSSAWSWRYFEEKNISDAQLT